MYKLDNGLANFSATYTSFSKTLVSVRCDHSSLSQLTCPLQTSPGFKLVFLDSRRRQEMARKRCTAEQSSSGCVKQRWVLSRGSKWAKCVESARTHPQQVWSWHEPIIACLFPTSLSPFGGSSGKLFCPNDGRRSSGLPPIIVLDEWFPKAFTAFNSSFHKIQNRWTCLV